jgi:hypothetical protein
MMKKAIVGFVAVAVGFGSLLAVRRIGREMGEHSAQMKAHWKEMAAHCKQMAAQCSEEREMVGTI